MIEPIIVMLIGLFVLARTDHIAINEQVIKSDDKAGLLRITNYIGLVLFFGGMIWSILQ
jgi:hypothetical protein